MPGHFSSETVFEIQRRFMQGKRGTKARVIEDNLHTIAQEIADLRDENARLQIENQTLKTQLEYELEHLASSRRLERGSD